VNDETMIEQPETPPELTPAGAHTIAGHALNEETERPGAKDSRASLACAATTRRGTHCGARVGVKDYGAGPRCPAHKPRVELGERGVRSPVRELRTPGDSLRLASFAAVAAMEGRIPASRANAVANACREFRRSHAQAGLHGLLDASVALVSAMLAFAERQGLGPRPETAFMRDAAVDRAWEEWKLARARWHDATE